MIRFKKGNSILSVLALIAVLLSLGCTAGDDGTIPITTSSEKALENYMMGRDLAEKLRAQESRKFFEIAVAEDPDFALGHLQLAQAQTTAKGFFDSFNRALARVENVSDGERLWILGVEAATNGDPMRQRQLYKELVVAYPLDERAWNLLGNHYFAQQDYRESINQYTKAIEINPEFSPTYNQLGYVYRFLKMYPEAEETFKKYIALIPDDPNPYDSYAELLLKIGKFEESIENYRTALNLNPQFVFSHIGIANNLTFLGRHDDAREQLDKMLAGAADDGQRRQAHFAKAVTFIDEGNFDAAMMEIEEQYKLAEKIKDFAAMSGDENVMGTILLEAGSSEKAMKHFQKAVTLINQSDLSEEVKENTRQAFHYNAGCASLKQQQIETAQTSCDAYQQRALRTRSPFQVRLYHQLMGMIALEEKDYRRAIDELSLASQQNPYNIYRMGQAYEGLKDVAKAKEAYERAAGFNALNNLNQAFIRARATQAVAAI